jgi:REP element-mobilizing transposase RayT
MSEIEMKNSYRIFTDKNYAYFVTWTVVDWLPLFAESAYRQIVLDSLNFLRAQKHTQLNAFVVMSSHIHAVLWPDDGISLSDVTRDFKRFTSRKISEEAERQTAKHLLTRFKVARTGNRAQRFPPIKYGRKARTPRRSSARSLRNRRSITSISTR